MFQTQNQTTKSQAAQVLSLATYAQRYEALIAGLDSGKVKHFRDFGKHAFRFADGSTVYYSLTQGYSGTEVVEDGPNGLFVKVITK